MDIKPIKTEKDLDAALEEIDALFRAEPDTPAGDRLEVLLALVTAYEAKHWSIEAADPITTIKEVMLYTGRTQKDLAALIGSKSRASEIMNRRRHLSIEAIWKLHREWKIPSDTLIQPYDLVA